MADLQSKLASVTAAQPADASIQSRCHIIKALFGVEAYSETLSTLFDLCTSLSCSSSSSSDGRTHLSEAITAASAAFVFLSSRKTSCLVLRQYVQQVFLPLAGASAGTTASSQLLQQLTHLLVNSQAWDILQEIHTHSVYNTLCCALEQAGSASASCLPQQHPSSGTSQQRWQITFQLPPAVSCIAAEMIIASAVVHQQQPGVQPILQLAAGPMFTMVCGLLTCSNASLRRSAFQQLLPALLSAAEAVSTETHSQCMQQLWQQCQDMVASPALSRRMGLSILLQYHAAWNVQPPAAAAACTSQATDSEQQFWVLVRDCLVDAESLNRKRAFRLLQLLLPESQLAAEPVWDVWLALYELLDEFSPHLVKAAWPQVSRLHPAAPQFAAEDAAADVAHSSKLNQLRRAKDAAAAGLEAANTGPHSQLQQLDELPMAFCWSSVIWTLALQHKNLQVQRMAMKTLLKRNWPPAVLHQVPVSFMTDTLLPALLSPIHHKMATAGGLSATGGAVGGADSQQQQALITAAGTTAEASPDGFSVISQACELLRGYVTAGGPARARALLAGGIQAAAKPGQDMPRSGLLAVLKVLAAAGKAAGGELLQDLRASEAAAFCEDCLSKLHSLLVKLQVYAGQAFRINCFTLLLEIAAAVAPAVSCKLASAAQLLQRLPAHLQSPGGQLHTVVRGWLLKESSSCTTGESDGRSDSSNNLNTWLAAGIDAMWQQYFNGAVSNGSGAGADGAAGPAQQQQQQWHARPQDYMSWRAMCDTYLRVLLCCGDQLQPHLSVTASNLADRTEQLTSRSYLAFGIPERVLVMLTVFLEGAEAAGRVAVAAGLPLPAVTTAAAVLAESVAGPLGRCLELYCSCYRSSPSALAGLGSNSDSGIGRSAAAGAAAGFGLSPAAWAGAALAKSAAQAAAAAAVMLARHASGCWDTCGAVDTSAAPAPTSTDSSCNGTGSAAGVVPSRGALTTLQQLLSKMADVGQQLTSKSLPGVAAGCVDDDAAAMEAGLHAAAAAEQSRASALEALGHISTGISRSLVCCPDLRSLPLPCSPVSWLTATLDEVQSAQAAHKQWLPAAAAVAGARSGDPMKGWLEGLDWNCTAGIITLAAVSADAGAAAAAAGLSNSVAGMPSNPAQSACAAAGCYLPAGLLASSTVCAVLCHALDSLQWTVSEAGSELLQLLRCLRRIWVLVASDEQLQAAAVSALVSAGMLSSPDEGVSALTALAGIISSGVLDMIRGSKKKPQLMYSLAVNTVLLPELCMFDPQQQPHLAALHTAASGPTPPLKRFIQGLVQQGQKGSPRLMLVLGLQLGTYVSCNPHLLMWYAEELRQCVLFGVASHGPGLGLDSETQGLPSLEEGQERSLLVEPLDSELQDAYTLTDIGGRVAVLCGLYQLAVAAGLAGQEGGSSSNSSSSGSGSSPSEEWVLQVESAGVGLWNSWLQAYLSDEVLVTDRFKVGSDIHRLKVRAWQGLATAVNFLSSVRQQEAAARAVEEILAQLSVNQPPSIKQYQEAIVAHLLLQHPQLYEDLLLPQITSVAKGSSATGSHILIAVQVALHCKPSQQLLRLPRLIKLLLPWTNHHTHNIRTFAQLGFCALVDSKPLDAWSGWEQGLGPGGTCVVGEVLRFMHDNLEFQRFRKAMGRAVLAWSPVAVTSPRRIFSCQLYLAGAEDTPVTFEGVPEALMDRLVNFLTAERAKLREAAVDRVAGFEGGPSIGSAAIAGSGGGDYQRKVTPSERAVLMADVLDEMEQHQGQLSAAGPAGTQRSDLIVVASLISKVPNLGGLARTAEVLGAGALVLADKRVAQEAGFTSVSVTAERWVPIEEVKEAALLGWLAAKQAQGYALVGLEQTAESTCLPSFNFPSKTVLVLGREKEGIPPEVIAMLDATVEIPQLGVVRSLNVHVSGAIAMYEYAKQQLAA